MTSDAGQAMLSLGKAVDGSGLERSLLELVKVRASQINGGAYCIDMVAINAFNRLAISVRVPAGTYQPQAVHA